MKSFSPCSEYNFIAPVVPFFPACIVSDVISVEFNVFILMLFIVPPSTLSPEIWSSANVKVPSVTFKVFPAPIVTLYDSELTHEFPLYTKASSTLGVVIVVSTRSSILYDWFIRTFIFPSLIPYVFKVIKRPTLISRFGVEGIVVVNTPSIFGCKYNTSPSDITFPFERKVGPETITFPVVISLTVTIADGVIVNNATTCVAVGAVPPKSIVISVAVSLYLNPPTSINYCNYVCIPSYTTNSWMI